MGSPLGENIGDLGGVQDAYEGLQIFLEQSGSTSNIDNYTQRNVSFSLGQPFREQKCAMRV
jgi:predicted metalloendopeptidase